MNHDVLMDSHYEEKLRLEEQASQVAQKAAEALQQSRMLRRQESVSVPTWTGKSGSAGGPSKKFGSTVSSRLASNVGGAVMAGVASGKAVSSAELLSKIRVTQERAAGVASECRAAEPGSSRPPINALPVHPEVLIREICSYMQQRCGRTSSASIVEYFKDRIPSKDLPLFKSLLKEIAVLEKNPSGSLWVLKSEYQQQG